MERVLFLLIILLVSSFEVVSQDLIVTLEGDSLNCKITKEKSDNIYFIYRRDYDIIETSLPLSKIKTHQLNFFPRSEIPYDWKTGIGELKPVKISIDGGFSLRLGKLPEDLPEELIDYYKNLKYGYNIGLSLYYYIDMTVGIGIKYHTFMSSNYIDNVTFSDPYGQTYTGRLSDKIKISFFGPAISIPLPSATGLSSFYTNYFIGYARYKNNALIPESYKITSGTVGLGVDGGYETELFSNFLIGFQASIWAGGFNKFKVDNGYKVQTIDLEEDKFESFYRIDFSLGIRFKL